MVTLFRDPLYYNILGRGRAGVVSVGVLIRRRDLGPGIGAHLFMVPGVDLTRWF